MYANENIVLAGDTNCAINSMDKRGGKPVDETQEAVVEFQSLLKTHSLIDAWRFKNPQSYGFTWSNPSMEIQCRLDYFLVSKYLNHLINESRILPHIYSDHSAVSLSLL